MLQLVILKGLTCSDVIPCEAVDASQLDEAESNENDFKRGCTFTTLSLQTGVAQPSAGLESHPDRSAGIQNCLLASQRDLHVDFVAQSVRKR